MEIIPRGRQSTPWKFSEPNISSLAACYLQLSLQHGHWGKSPEEKSILLGRSWALSPQREGGTSGARLRWALKDVGNAGGMQMDAKPCRGMQRDALRWEDARGAAG